MIRQAHITDLAALGEFFAGLSAQTRYLRFFSPMTPTSAMLRRLAGAAGVDAVVALSGGVIVGHAMAADQAGPGEERSTEIGVVVADAWQGQGVASALLRALIARAAGRGVAWLKMDVLHLNDRVFAMIARHWPDSRTDRGSDFATVHARVPGHAGPLLSAGLPQSAAPPGPAGAGAGGGVPRPRPAPAPAGSRGGPLARQARAV